MKPPGTASPPPPAETGRQAMAWAQTSGAATLVVERLRTRSRQRRRRSMAGAAIAAAFLALATVALWQPFPRAPAAASQPAGAVVSLPLRQVLDDGSVAELRDGTAIEVRFTPNGRKVVLRSGEAHFAVTPDPDRPFVVAAGEVEVRAVGTAFAVQIAAQAIEVLVTAGTVAVRAGTPGPDEVPLVLEAGGRALVPTVTGPDAWPPTLETLTPEQQGQRLAWRVPRFEFSGTALGEVVALVNRHGLARLHLEPGLASLQVSGTLRANDTDSLLLLLRNEFGVEAETRPDGSRFLRRR